MGAALDVIFGGISVMLVEALTGLGRRRAEFAFTATLVTGALLSLEFMLVFLVTYGAWRSRGFPSRPPGRCEACGYDLRGATSPKCPECGAVHGLSANTGS